MRRFLSIEAQDIRPNIYKCTRYTLNRAEPLNEISGNTSCTGHLTGLLPAKGVTQWILFWDRRKACVIKAEAYLAKGAFEEALQKTVLLDIIQKTVLDIIKKKSKMGWEGGTQIV